MILLGGDHELGWNREFKLKIVREPVRIDNAVGAQNAQGEQHGLSRVEPCLKDHSERHGLIEVWLADRAHRSIDVKVAHLDRQAALLQGQPIRDRVALEGLADDPAAPVRHHEQDVVARLDPGVHLPPAGVVQEVAPDHRDRDHGGVEVAEWGVGLCQRLGIEPCAFRPDEGPLDVAVAQRQVPHQPGFHELIPRPRLEEIRPDVRNAIGVPAAREAELGPRDFERRGQD